MTRSLLALAALLAALVIAGCGGSEEGAENPLAVLDLAAERTPDVESARQKIVMDSDLGGEQMSMEAEGSFTADSQNGVLKASMVTEGEELEFEAISVDGTMYMRSDDLPLPDGKEWFKTPDAPTSTMEPGEFVKHLRESQGVENMGSEEIRGEPTTHFRGPLDVEKVAEASGQNELLQAIRKQPDAKDYDVVIDIWVLEDGLPARMAVKVTAPEDVGGAMTMTTDLLEYDVPVDAEAPPADKVAESFG